MAGEITVLQLQNAALDVATIAQVAMVNYTTDTTTNRDGDVINTLQGQLKLLGYLPAVTYAGAILFGANDRLKTVLRNGIIYAPVITALPFTTSGTWSADDELKFYAVPQTSNDFYTDSGAANAYVLTAGANTIPQTAYFEGMIVEFVADNANTTASTVNVSGLGAKDISATYGSLTALTTGQLSGLTRLIYDGTRFSLIPNYALANYVKYGTISFSSAGGVIGTLTYNSLKVSSTADKSNTFSILGNQALLTSNDAADATAKCLVAYGNGNFAVEMFGSTSGSDLLINLDRASGFLATINATGVQQKVAEWDNVALKATKAFQLPTYADLAAISAAITAPVAGMLCYVTGQGMAIYKASWVRTTDETTAIT